VCVPKLHTANHLGELSEPPRHSTTKTCVCVLKVHTTNHLGELGEPVRHSTTKTRVCSKTTHNEPLRWTGRTT